MAEGKKLMCIEKQSGYIVTRQAYRPIEKLTQYWSYNRSIIYQYIVGSKKLFFGVFVRI
jgi:hypothetical protein